MNKQYGHTLFELLIGVVAILGVIGWVWNIVKIVHSDFAVLTGMLVIRCLGVIIAPLGAVLGWL